MITCSYCFTVVVQQCLLTIVLSFDILRALYKSTIDNNKNEFHSLKSSNSENVYFIMITCNYCCTVVSKPCLFSIVLPFDMLRALYKSNSGKNKS